MKSFEELLEEYRGSAEAYVKYKVSSREDAEDILQDTYVQAFNSFQSLEKEESFRSWLISIARNKVTDYYRRKARFCEVPLDEQTAVYAGPGRTVHYQVQDTMALLSDEERKVLLLYYWEELSVREIAESCRYRKERSKEGFIKPEKTLKKSILRRK
ncbi:MAG: RNA polymerase sigma factor [Erysipelotrichaceae bacterium]|nr:RNA polymerase sigma factor [Erysipelotrichaceae bacterium]